MSNEIQNPDCPPCAPGDGSVFRFRLSAKYPPNSDVIGGTFVEGEIKCDMEDLPEAAIALLKDLVDSWDMKGQTHIEFTISPNPKLTDAQRSVE